MTNQDTDARLERLGASYQLEEPPKAINRNYTRWVKSLRILLPLIAVGMIGLLILSAEQDDPVLPIQEIKTPSLPTASNNQNAPVIEKNELVNPQFESQTKDGKTYKITAENAVQKLQQPDLILLKHPQGQLEMEPHPLLVTADDGTYNQETQFMTLNQNVKISQEGNGEIRLKSLEADLSRGEMFSPFPIEAEGAYGTLRADSLRITNNGMNIILEGPVRLTINEGLETWID